MSEKSREFDVVLMGATGFTGRLTAEYLAERAEEEELKWALGGRSEEKLKEVRARLGAGFEELPIVVADCFDRESLGAMAGRTRVVCSTVGPYSKYGSELVAACVEKGADYCDLTGEAHWIRKMIDAHHGRAEEKGVRIVHCCGFDSIPSDLGTLMIQESGRERFGRSCEEVNFYLAKGRGGVSGGTLESVAASMEEVGKDKEIARQMLDPYGLNPEGEREGKDGDFQKGVRYDSMVNGWTAPFVMAVINEKVVRRSNALLGYRYGKEFRYREASLMGQGVVGALRATGMTAGLGAFAAGMALKPTRKLLQRFFLPGPGEGPSEETREEGYFRVRLVGRGRDRDGKSFEVRGEVGAEKDPGYGATAVMLGESAISLARDEVEEGLEGGVLTPASAMGMALVERLREAGMTFQVEE